MKYFVDDVTGQVYAYAADGSQDSYIVPGLRAMTAAEVEAHLNPPPSHEQLVAIENTWRENEILAIGNQLLAIEEAEAAAEEGEDPPADLLPGTRNQWLAYRTKVRAWKESNLVFPNSLFRPARPK